MIQLSPDECRVLGVLVEKALTTPQQYPLSLNALTAGCNQKNNRLPVVEWDEERVYDAVDSLRAKGLVREANLTGSRVAKFRHLARETLEVDTAQLVLLTELLLRGPQSIGDLRGNASRMHPLESIESTRAVLDTLMQRPEPMVKEVPPPPGGRARLFVQLLCPDLHRITAPAHEVVAPSSETAAPAPGVTARVQALEADVERLKTALRGLAAKLGEGDPLA